MNWISVKDRVPEHEQIVLCKSKNLLPIISIFHKSNSDYLFLDATNMRFQINDATHWMSLPEFHEE